jgi:hypothetical protein
MTPRDADLLVEDLLDLVHLWEEDVAYYERLLKAAQGTEVAVSVDACQQDTQDCSNKLKVVLKKHGVAKGIPR